MAYLSAWPNWQTGLVALILQGYDFTIQYGPRKYYGNADAL